MDRRSAVSFITGRQTVTSTGMESEQYSGSEINLPHMSVDLVIMNPPFTRPTNHESTAVPVPSFAGFGTSEAEQYAMAERLNTLNQGLKEMAGHGNVGLASNFMDLAHAKVREGGVVAFVLPATFISGKDWTNARNLIESYYTDIVIITIASSGNTDRAFSDDTGMAECLVVATRRNGHTDDMQGACLYVNLIRRPQNVAEGVEFARSIRSIEGDAGGIDVGTQEVGIYFRAKLKDGGFAQMSQPDVARTALGLGKLFKT